MDAAPRLLLVEDDQILLKVVELNLKSAGFSVVTAANGAEGLAALQEGSFDLIVTDCQMPVMSGVEMCESIVETGLSDAPVILCTAKSYELDRDHMKRIRVRHVVGKPFSPRRLVELVAQEVTPAVSSQ